VSQYSSKALTSAQIRAARALLRWTAENLARQSAVSLRTIQRAELAECDTSLTTANDLAVRRALETAGVEFIDEREDAGPGVRLRKALREKG
jgi:transcriptional regulator with XRE-family HTH domain